eukprot:8432530-Ditylum_brightwellii.AAC.1
MLDHPATSCKYDLDTGPFQPHIPDSDHLGIEPYTKEGQVVTIDLSDMLPPITEINLCVEVQ